MMTKINQVVIGIVLLLVFTGLVGIGSWLYRIASQTGPNHFAGSEGGLVPAIIVLIGVAGIFLLFVGAGVAYSALGLADREQPFGMPDGSVRATVASMLLLMFGIVPIFLYQTIGGLKSTMDNLTYAEAVAQKTHLLADNSYIGVKPDLPPTAPAEGSKTTYYAITYVASPSGAATDLAKSFFTALSTLVASVSSFFFGSAVTAAATKAAVGRPSDANRTP